MMWWFCLPSGQKLFAIEQKEFIKRGKSLHIDHSYKYVKSIGVTDTDGKWVCVSKYLNIS